MKTQQFVMFFVGGFAQIMPYLLMMVFAILAVFNASIGEAEQVVSPDYLNNAAICSHSNSGEESEAMLNAFVFQWDAQIEEEPYVGPDFILELELLYASSPVCHSQCFLHSLTSRAPPTAGLI